jgi:uncharacterized coiled-coil DUF342 family protein
MFMENEKDTLPNIENLFALLKTVHEEVKHLRQETKEQIDGLRREVDGLRQEVYGLRQEIKQIKAEMNEKFESNRLEIMSVRVQLDRLDAQSHEILGFAYNNRADVSILREEVSAWAKDVRKLQGVI